MIKTNFLHVNISNNIITHFAYRCYTKTFKKVVEINTYLKPKKTFH